VSSLSLVGRAAQKGRDGVDGDGDVGASAPRLASPVQFVRHGITTTPPRPPSLKNCRVRETSGGGKGSRPTSIDRATSDSCPSNGWRRRRLLASELRTLRYEAGYVPSWNHCSSFTLSIPKPAALVFVGKQGGSGSVATARKAGEREGNSIADRPEMELGGCGRREKNERRAQVAGSSGRRPRWRIVSHTIELKLCMCELPCDSCCPSFFVAPFLVEHDGGGGGSGGSGGSGGVVADRTGRTLRIYRTGLPAAGGNPHHRNGTSDEPAYREPKRILPNRVPARILSLLSRAASS
jgi:hypothetical protein